MRDRELVEARTAAPSQRDDIVQIAMKKKRMSLLLLAFAAMPVVAQRLPRTVIPVHYDITLAPDFKSDSFRGSEVIEVSVQGPSREITLHALEMTIDEAIVESAGRSQVATVRLDPKTQTATLGVAAEILPGPARLRFRFHGMLNNELRGLYLGRANGRKYVATQFEATDARRAFPSFDEPEMKATFALTVIADEADRVISNSSVVADTPGPEAGKHTVRFATTPRMSSYLVALVVGDFDCIRGSSEGVPQGVCGTPNRIADGKLALRMSQDFLKYYNNYFGAPYPFGKLDHIGIPDFSAGAMENSGAIIYRDIYLLKDDRTISPESEQSLAGIISHEIAHMWFGDLVTMKWWNDLWLNEGFADWIAPKPIRVMHPEWNFEVDAVEEIIGPMRADSLQNTRPIQVDVHSAEQADELFDSITYGKASAVLGMVEAYIGEENFRKGVSRYIQNHSFSNATADDFATALARETDVPVDDVLDSFVKQPGVPVIHVESTCVNGKTILKTRQKRFFLDPRLANRESD